MASITFYARMLCQPQDFTEKYKLNVISGRVAAHEVTWWVTWMHISPLPPTLARVRFRHACIPTHESTYGCALTISGRTLVVALTISGRILVFALTISGRILVFALTISGRTLIVALTISGRKSFFALTMSGRVVHLLVHDLHVYLTRVIRSMGQSMGPPAAAFFLASRTAAMAAQVTQTLVRLCRYLGAYVLPILLPLTRVGLVCRQQEVYKL
jgi:hypothetical protein